MKQLKFMLAAATAISLATAAQATDFENSTNFESADEKYKVGDAFPAAGEKGWVAPDDNESTIGAVTDFDGKTGPKKYAGGAHTKGLYLSTGETPLLRHIETYQDGTAYPQNLASGQIYIDTMVQFTPTPAGEEPDADTDTENKLMLYAQEVTVEGAETPVVKLFIVTSQYHKGGLKEDTCTPVSINTGVTVEKDTWYRLTVTAYSAAASKGKVLPLFKVKLDGVDLTSGTTALHTADDYTIFPSIQGVTDTATIEAVGFAGEGKVDDLVMTTDDPAATTVDFTFTWSTAGISAVKYAIGDATDYIDLGADKKITNLASDAIINIQIKLADWYAVKDGADLQYVASEKTADLDDLIKEIAASDINVTVPDNTDSKVVDAALAWAKNAGKTPAAVEAAGDHFFNNYLLNVADLAVEPKIEIVSVDASTTPMTITAKVTDANGKAYEKVIVGDDAATDLKAPIKYRAAATLEALKDAGLKDAIGADDKFVQVVVE